MSSKNDTGEIIKEFLDLWQKQFSYMTKDPETVAKMLTFFQQSQDGLFNTAGNKNVKPDTDADTHDNADAELRKLRERIAGLEERVVELESGTRKPGERTAKTIARKK